MPETGTAHSAPYSDKLPTMTQPALFARHDDSPGRAVFGTRPIDVRIEMAAYEALWLRDGMWFAELAKLFSENPGALPSELVDADETDLSLAKLKGLLGKSTMPFDARVHGAGEYPDRLREAIHPVEVLYFRGNWEWAHSRSVAIVGTREPSDEGIKQARRIASRLAEEKFTIVSGLAKGIDSAAHNEALAVKGRTIAVIGTPLTEAYPRENASLQELIATEHLLISQVPFLRYAQQHWKANRYFFPARNVTMSALTEATIIVEAGDTSGTLVQARAALAQGRKLFILESLFRRSDLLWPAKFEALGAVRVANVSQILDALTHDTASTY